MKHHLLDLTEEATKEQANAWAASPEQYLFCIDLLEISAHQSNSDELVNKLEAQFTLLIEQSKQENK